MSAQRNQTVGRGDYVVKEGDCMNSIAARFGFFWESIWNHPDNSELKQVRQDPMVLMTGDRVTIPERQVKREPGDTGTRHRFRRRGVPAKLKLRFLDEDEPRANVRCIVEIDGHQEEHRTDAEGVLTMPIPPDAKKGFILVGEDDDQITYELQLGHLEPFDSVKGVQQRLRSLGMFEGKIDGLPGPRTADAIRAFQMMCGLEETGELDDALCNKLKDLNGS